MARPNAGAFQAIDLAVSTEHIKSINILFGFMEN
jgi:hypothetical protein